MRNADLPGYNNVHMWLRYHYGSANKCENEECLGKSKRFHWANIRGIYKWDRAEFMMLCAQCHAQKDFRNSHCRHGHELTPENIYQRPNGGRRNCRACDRERWHRHQAELRNKAIQEVGGGSESS